MSTYSDISRNNSDIRLVAENVCQEFRRKYQQAPNLRIEQFSTDIDSWVEKFDSQVQTRAKSYFLAELLYTELDLRLAQGQPISLEEYAQRFIQFKPAISIALEKIKKRYPDFIARVSPTQVTKSRNSAINKNLESELDLILLLDSPIDREIPQNLAHFNQIIPVSSGGFGIVCRAFDSLNGRVVALKFPRRDKLRDNSDLKQFIDEARKAMPLTHPGIVQTYSIVEDAGLLAIVQQFIEGVDLKQQMAQFRSHQEIVELIAKIAEALAYAHRQGIFHRDIKPGNILIDQQGQPYLTDFGLALHERDQLLLGRQRCGTTHYMPPEMVAGLTRRLDGRSDIWSLGVVLYELLTQRKPFDGLTENEIFDQIENDDPRPPRQIDGSIDRELQRICLKCLERQQRDRYPTADELADDLRHWIRNPTPTASQSPALFQPRGLRSYTTEDANFFLDLLPGPRDRNQVPDSIRFWQSRICEPVSPENRISLGVIFGPSGSGKSSFVKAGLIPRLGSDILTIYLEANQTDTEDRLLKLLRYHIPAIPTDLSLVDALLGLTEGQWNPPNQQKVLIAIDQFEQRLSLADDFETSTLVKALRCCDGERTQCLVLVRDDFMMSLSRFMDALELDFREGENAQAIDLFDRRHARRVLEKLGRAYEQLPAEPTELSDEQKQFIAVAINQLAQDEYIICVHLTLFAEMFRSRDWNLSELNQVGGVAGTGEKFLEATFGSTARDKRLRTCREETQRILEALLPTAGADIRGSMKSAIQLKLAAGMDDQTNQFQNLMQVLDGQLKLITRADPNTSQLPDKTQHPSNESTIAWYQLTHDYLVPSIRAWLESSWGNTAKGRAKLRLKNIATQIVPNQPLRVLPTDWEWLSWNFLIPGKTMNPTEKKIMQAAGKRFAQKLGIALVCTVLIGLFAGWGIYRYDRAAKMNDVDRLIVQLIGEQFEEVPKIVAQIQDRQLLAGPKLLTLLNQESKLVNSPRYLRLAMGMLPFDDTHIYLLRESILSTHCSPQQLQATVSLLGRYSDNSSWNLESSYRDVQNNPRIRLRALAAEQLRKNGQFDWSEFADMAVNGIWNEPLSTVDSWLDLLKSPNSTADPIVDSFIKMMDSVTADNRAIVLAKAISRFSLDQSKPMMHLAEWVEQHQGNRTAGILAAIREQRKEKEFIEVLSTKHEEASEPVKQVNLAIAMLNLGVSDPIISHFTQEFHNPRAFLAIQACSPDRVNLYDLIDLYRKLNLNQSEKIDLRRSLLQAMAHHFGDDVDSKLKEQLQELAIYHAENDLDACCFSTAELILSRIGNLNKAQPSKPWRQNRLRKSQNGILGNVLIDKLGDAYSIVEFTDPEAKERKFAISTTELTNGQILRFLTENQQSYELENHDQPFHISDYEKYETVIEYCNWLTQKNGLTADDVCYKGLEIWEQSDPVPIADPLTKGYRIPLLIEWKAAYQSNEKLINQFSDATSHLLSHAWMIENSFSNARPVAKLLPDARGLFDMMGNYMELCQETSEINTIFLGLGSSARANSLVLRLGPQLPVDIRPKITISVIAGARLVRGLD